jgi:hypothetical protein
MEVAHGVPQGSILGPLLFLIYINDLPKILTDKSLPILFADDTSIVISRENTEQLIGAMNEIYSILDCWFKNNLMSLNLTKTNYIDFSVNNQISKRIGNLDSNISRTMYIKFRGLNIQYDLAWNNHIDEIIKKLNITSYMIRNINL